MISDYFLISFRSIRQRKLRSSLTIIGIIIGITAIISLITISQGLENAINEQFEQFGTNRINVFPKGGDPRGRAGLEPEDVKAIEQIQGVEYANEFIAADAKISFKNEDVKKQVVGIKLETLKRYLNDVGLDIIQGRIPGKNEEGVAILGFKVGTTAFSEELRVRNRFGINDKKFVIVGVMEEIGNPDDDNSIWIGLEDAREIFNRPDGVNIIDVKVSSGQNVDEVADRIREDLEDRKGDNFEVFTSEEFQDQINTILGIVRVVLVGIAAISIVVGGVGILNSMYTNVLERTKEVGVMKAVGAKNSDIMIIFVIEAGILGLVGGIIGTTLGSLIGIIVGRVADAAGFQLLKIVISPGLIVFGLSFAFIIGMISGYLPARQASKMKIVEALRY